MSGEIPYIDPKGRYPIQWAAQLIPGRNGKPISRSTLLDHTKKAYISCHINPRNGRKVYLGADLIAYRDSIV